MASAKKQTKLPYRRGVGIVLINSKGKVFVAERLGAPGAWQMPQGGIDDGEKPRQAALRELEEETGTAKAEIIAVTNKWLRYDLPPELLGKAWKGKYRGQEQKWFLMRFTGKDSDININTPDPEFTAWKWIAFGQLTKVIVAFKRELYLKVVGELGPVLDQLARAREQPKPLPGKAKTARGRGTTRGAKLKRRSA